MSGPGVSSDFDLAQTPQQDFAGPAQKQRTRRGTRSRRRTRPSRVDYNLESLGVAQAEQPELLQSIDPGLLASQSEPAALQSIAPAAADAGPQQSLAAPPLQSAAPEQAAQPRDTDVPSEAELAVLADPQVLANAQRIVELGQDPSKLASYVPEPDEDLSSELGEAQTRLPELYVPPGLDAQSMVEPEPAPLQQPASPEDAFTEMGELSEGMRESGAVQTPPSPPSPAPATSGPGGLSQTGSIRETALGAAATTAVRGAPPPLQQKRQTPVSLLRTYFVDPLTKSTQFIAFYARLKNDYANAIKFLEVRQAVLAYRNYLNPSTLGRYRRSLEGAGLDLLRGIDRRFLVYLPTRFASFTDDLRLFLAWPTGNYKTIVRNAGGRVNAVLTAVQTALRDKNIIASVAGEGIFDVAKDGKTVAPLTERLLQRIEPLVNGVITGENPFFKINQARESAQEARGIEGFVRSAGELAGRMVESVGKLLESKAPRIWKFLIKFLGDLPLKITGLARGIEQVVIRATESVLSSSLVRETLLARLSISSGRGFLAAGGGRVGRQLARLIPGVGAIVAMISAYYDFRSFLDVYRIPDYPLSIIRFLHVLTDLGGAVPGAGAAIAYSGDVISILLETLVALGRFFVRLF